MEKNPSWEANTQSASKKIHQKYIIMFTTACQWTVSSARWIQSTNSHTEHDCLLGCCMVQSRRKWPVFQRCLLPPTSGWSGTHCPADGGSMHIWNVGKFLQDYIEQHPKRQLSSYLLLWEPEISLNSHTISCKQNFV
jgi:hypothetical protein